MTFFVPLDPMGRQPVPRRQPAALATTVGVILLCAANVDAAPQRLRLKQTLSQRGIALAELLQETIEELRPVLRSHGLSPSQGPWRIESFDFARAFEHSVQGKGWATRVWGWGGKPKGWLARLPDAWLRALVRAGGRALGDLTNARIDTANHLIRVNRRLVQKADHRLVKTVLAHELAHEALDRRYAAAYQPSPFLKAFGAHFPLSAALRSMRSPEAKEHALQEFLVDKLLREGHPERIMRDYEARMGDDFARLPRLPRLPLLDRALAGFASDNKLAIPDVKTVLTAMGVALLSPLARYTYAAYVEGGKIPARAFPRLWTDPDHREAVLGAKARRIIRTRSNRALARRLLARSP
jgi:hypothetical protein